MQTLKLMLVFFLVAAAILIVFGMAGLKSQARYAAKMNAPTLVKSNQSSSGTTVKHSNTVSGLEDNDL